MVVLKYFKNLVSSLSIVGFAMASSTVHGFNEQCEEVAKVLKAKTNKYAQIIDTRRYNLQLAPASQGGQDNVDTLLKLPSADRCQATWTQGRDKFSYMCDWRNSDKEESARNLNIIGDIIEKCVVESNLTYDRVNPKTVGNLSFITFYFEKATNLKIVLMKFGSQIKSNFEFSGNQQVKPRSQVATNGQFDSNAQWPSANNAVANAERTRLENQQRARQAQAEKDKQAAARLAEQRAEQERLEQARLDREKQQAEEKLAEQQQLQQIVQQLPPQSTVPGAAQTTQAQAEQTAQAQSPQAEPGVESGAIVASVGDSAVTAAPGAAAASGLVDEDSPSAGESSPESSVVNSEPPLLDPSKTRCWYFASYSSAYQEEDTDDAKSFGAVLLSNVAYVDVDYNEDLEQAMKQRLATKAETAWETIKPNPAYVYYNSQAFGHLSCDEDAKGRMETIHETMQSVDWVGAFETTVD
ncbi:hypothetical protein FLL45_14985 [Aliikangiella marina]|uniref:Uncharacterized protein n=1 Tax=Aliikangiella marina TaxID=1712262 RepID=A0A545T6C5_9GAMM|nr:hypothetical protein [Aliikangiella marina]TQV72774.1 hypothetical protein FLL45_14985 [Aliikangiella marina]